MENNEPNIFRNAKPGPPPTEEELLDKALYAVQDFLYVVKNDKEKIDDFRDLVDHYCWDAQKEKK